MPAASSAAWSDSAYASLVYVAPGDAVDRAALRLQRLARERVLDTAADLCGTPVAVGELERDHAGDLRPVDGDLDLDRPVPGVDDRSVDVSVAPWAVPALGSVAPVEPDDPDDPDDPDRDDAAGAGAATIAESPAVGAIGSSVGVRNDTRSTRAMAVSVRAMAPRFGITGRNSGGSVRWTGDCRSRLRRR